jgi:hypothetical protein
MKSIDIYAPLLTRIFGVKDGLAFYYLEDFKAEDPESYTDFCANGPPGDFVPTLQMERKISELLLSMIAQACGTLRTFFPSLYHDSNSLICRCQRLPCSFCIRR